MNRTPLFLEALEDRTTPATYGVPWLDPMHLSLSFAADGTPIVGHHSELLEFLDPRFGSREAWQREFVRAFQTWAQHANLSVGLRPERITPATHPFGVAGSMQFDTRFGDIRVGGHAMAADALAIAAPPDPFMASTLAGDMFLNITADINPTNLFPILLHEVGHALGLDHSDDPQSVMYSHLNSRTALAPSDVTALRALYGTRGRDRNECGGGPGQCPGNDTPTRATDIKYEHIRPPYTGTTPLVVWGDLAGGGDVDYFKLQTLEDGYRGPVTFWLDTRGLSGVLPHITIQQGRSNGTITNPNLGTRVITEVLGDFVTVTIPQVTSENSTRYYARIESSQGGLFGIGRYALGVTFDQRVVAGYRDRMNKVMRGRYDLLREDPDRAIHEVFINPPTARFELDGHTNDTPDVATLLEALEGFREDSRYEILAGLEDDADLDWYLLTSPEGQQGRPVVLTATFTLPEFNGTLPYLWVFDSVGQFLTAGLDVLLNGNGTYTLQIPDLAPEASYYLVVSPRTADAVGNYALTLDFGDRAAGLPMLTRPGDTLSEARPQAEYALYIGRSQLFQFSFSVGDLFAFQQGYVRMQVFDSQQREIYALAAWAGDTVSDQALFLVPGEYRVYFTAEGYGGPPPDMTYKLRGINLTDPIGPVLGDTLLRPQYVSEDDPSLYAYPGGYFTPIPFLWALLS